MRTNKTSHAKAHRLRLAWALIKWDLLELLGRSTERVQADVMRSTFGLELDDTVVKHVAREVSHAE